jgi:hypothetical protein
VASPISSTRRLGQAVELMTAFAERTGLEPPGPPRRYLWTDAFAVGNFLGLARATGEERHRGLALRLVDQVHHVLGRHRPDDRRTGWLAGGADSDGEAHPTRAGLRIGKKLPERGDDEPFDDDLEWERDGQYFHYLTRWAHALVQTTRATGEGVHAARARELMEAAHRAFVWAPPGGARRMYWKMSVDLSRPLVPSMGQHDALDGFVACLACQASPAAAKDFAGMIDVGSLASADPLGIGGLLTDAYFLHRLAGEGARVDGALVDDLLEGALAGLAVYLRRGGLRGPAAHRLAFREAGLAIGLQAAARLRAESGAGGAPRERLLRALAQHDHLVDEVLALWLDEGRARDRAGSDLRDIDEVMLATVLLPSGYLGDG